MIYIIGVLVITAILLFWFSSQQRRSTGLPAGRVTYSDHKHWGTVESALYDSKFNLTGKPDFIVETKSGPIPVEVKSGRIKNGPYDSHIYQLAAYCLLIDQNFDTRPDYGILHYSNQDYAIDYTSELENKLIYLLREIHSMSRKTKINRSHEAVNRCQKCSYKSNCDQSLA